MSRRSAKRAAEVARYVSFWLVAPAAHTVFLAGSFNDWNAGGLPMTNEGDGNWRVSVALKPGSYEYRFIVDGVWQEDPGAFHKVLNPYGSQNSVVEIT